MTVRETASCSIGADQGLQFRQAAFFTFTQLVVCPIPEIRFLCPLAIGAKKGSISARCHVQVISGQNGHEAERVFPLSMKQALSKYLCSPICW